jgi:hypothetical protein
LAQGQGYSLSRVSSALFSGSFIQKPTRENLPLPDIRHYILWEMHNGFNVDAFNQIFKTFDIPITKPDVEYKQLQELQPLHKNATPEEQEFYDYKWAAIALAIEWEEWKLISVYDSHTKIINKELSESKDNPYINRRYELFYTNPPPRLDWSDFRNYIALQRVNGHTIGYDPKAADETWKGEAILQLIEEKNPSCLKISNLQPETWQKLSTKITEVFPDNPFLAHFRQFESGLE